MELVAMDMKQRGLYIARQLSFYGVAFRIEDVALPRDFVHMYNASVRLVCRFTLFTLITRTTSMSFIQFILLQYHPPLHEIIVKPRMCAIL